jgi:preprotein translocase subunit SecA
MDYLREGITLRGYGQRDPLVEYQREGFDMFSAMMEGIKEESVASLFNLQVQWQDNPIVEDATPGGEGGATPGAAQGGFVITAPGAAGGAAPGTAAPGAAAASAAGAGLTGPATRPGRHSRTGTQPSRSAAPARPDGQAAPGQPGAAGGTAVPAALAARGLDRPQRKRGLQYTAPSEDASGQAERRAASSGGTASSGGADYSKVGRNAPCPCGSGRKFKQCHGDPRNR